jgi:LacI family transcriptional regulator
MTVTIRDVAARAGVSVGTVSNVLNARGHVNARTVEAVRAAISDLGFVRNDAARQLRAGRSRGIGLVVLNVANPFFAAIARGAEARAAEEGMVVLLGSSEQLVEREESYLDLFLEQRVSGVLVSPAADDLANLDRLAASGISVVLVDRETSGSPLPSVAVDDVEGGHLTCSSADGAASRSWAGRRRRVRWPTASKEHDAPWPRCPGRRSTSSPPPI